MKKKFLVPVALALTGLVATSASAAGTTDKLLITKSNPDLQPAQYDNHSSHYSHSSHSSHYSSSW